MAICRAVLTARLYMEESNNALSAALNWLTRKVGGDPQALRSVIDMEKSDEPQH